MERVVFLYLGLSCFASLPSNNYIDLLLTKPHELLVSFLPKKASLYPILIEGPSSLDGSPSIEDFEVIEKLGKGGFSQVYLGRVS